VQMVPLRVKFCTVVIAAASSVQIVPLRVACLN
jgi:hypothetical protein